MIKALLRTFLLLFILIIGLVAFLLTPMGLQLSVDIASHFLPGQLTIKKISGVIIGPLSVEQFHYEDKTQTINIKQLRLTWEPIDLFKKQLHINTLHVQGLHIITDNNLPKEWTVDSIEQAFNTIVASLKKRALPFHATINHADFEDTQIIDPASKRIIEIPTLSLHALLSEKTWDAEISATIKKPTSFVLHFQLLGTPDDYTMHLGINGNQTHWSLIGKGNIESLTLHTPSKLFLGGSLDAQFYIHWEHDLEWQGKLIAKKINLTLLDPASIKSLSLTMNSSGDNKTTSVIMHNDAHIQTPDGEVHLIVNIGKTWYIQWQAKIHALPGWLTNVSKNIESHGKIEGDLNNPHFNIALNGRFNNARKITSAAIHLDGNFLNHTLLAKLTSADQKVNLKLQGHLKNLQTWHGTLQQLTVGLNRSISWQLTKSTALSISKNSIHLTPLCLQSPTAGNMCVHGQWLNKKINGDATINITRFDWLHSLFHHIKVPTGQLHGNFKVDGTLQDPKIKGTLNLNKGSIVFPHLNITLSDISAALTSDRDLIKITAQAYSQKQPFNLTGTIDLTKPDFLAEASLTSKQAPVINTDEYKVSVGSNLKFNIKNQDIFITGNIAIPTADIQPNDTQTTTTLPENDIVYVGTETHPAMPFWNIHTDVTVDLGDKVHIIAAGANASLGGKVQLLQNPNENIFATGNIFARSGTFSVYGQTLTITPDSYLAYSHNLLDNPTLNITATKIITEIRGKSDSSFTQEKLLVGVKVHGSIGDPKITFFSNRSSLSQADILSYILLGYGNDSNAPGNTDFLLRALSAVKISSQGLFGKQNIASQIQSGLGLSELGIESETTVDPLGNPLSQHSAFVVGKSITQRFYVRLSIGLLTPVNVYQLGYLLNQNWSVQGDSSTLGNGADVLYTFSRK